MKNVLVLIMFALATLLPAGSGPFASAAESFDVANSLPGTAIPAGASLPSFDERTHFLTRGITTDSTDPDIRIRDCTDALNSGRSLEGGLFIRTYGGAEFEMGGTVLNAPDGGFFVAGQTYSYTESDFDQLLLKFDSSWTLQWARQIGGSGWDFEYESCVTSDGGLVVGGYTASYGAGEYDVLLLKINLLGDLQWATTAGFADSDEAIKGIVEAPNGDLVATGTFDGPTGIGGYDALLFSFDSEGGLQWAQVFGGGGDDEGMDIDVTSDGAFLITGYTDSFGAGGWDAFVAQFDSAGNYQWSNTYGGASPDSAYAVQTLTDGSIMVAGQTNSYGSSGGSDQFLLKLGVDGALEWARTAGGSPHGDTGWGVLETADGGIVVVGDTFNYGGGNSDVMLLKYNTSGTLQWARTAGGAADEHAYSVMETPSGELAVAAQTESFGAGSYDMLLLKTDAFGSVPDSAVMDFCDPNISSPSPVITSPTMFVGTVIPTVTSPVVDMDVIWPDEGTISSHDYPDPGYFVVSTNRDDSDWSAAVEHTTDGGYVVAGQADMSPATEDDAFLYKYDNAGTLIWAQTAGGTETELIDALAETLDGGYILAGSSDSFNVGDDYDLFIVKFSAAGFLEWARSMGGSGTDRGRDICPTMDGGYVVTGELDGAVLLVKLDASGDLEWARTVDAPGMEAGYSVRETSGGSFIVTGSRQNQFDFTDDIYLLLFDETGGLTWALTTSGPGVDVGFAVIETSDGGYAVTGTSTSFGTGNHDLVLLKYDAAGTLLWARSTDAGRDELGNDLFESSDGELVVGGDRMIISPTQYSNGLVMRFDSSGTMLWSTTTNSSVLAGGSIASVSENSHGAIVLTGGWLNGTSWEWGPYLAKLTVRGELPDCNVFIPAMLEPTSFNPTVTPIAEQSNPVSLATTAAECIRSYTIPETAFICQSPYTVSARMSCVPSSGALPFSTLMSVQVDNQYTGLTRRMAVRISAQLADGSHYPVWRSGFTNIAAGSSYLTSWNQNLPALGSLLGNNIFTVDAMDVTPSPYNQAPHPPSGDTGSQISTVWGLAP